VLRIAILTSTFSPAIGGAESYALMLANGLEQRGHRPVVITDGLASFPVEGHQRAPLPEMPAFRFPVLGAERYGDLVVAKDKVRWEQMYFGLSSDIAAQLRDMPIDLVHANSQECAIVGSMLALERSVPLVCTFHEQAPEDEPLGIGRCQLIYRHLPIDAIIAGSQFYLDRVSRFCASPGQGHLIYHGIDTARFSPGARSEAFRRRYGVASDQLLVLCSARISPRKGQLELVDAFARVIREIPNVRLLLAGSCNSGSRAYRARVADAVATLGLSGVVSFDETLQLEDMPEAYRSADLVVQPSQAEGLGLALLEAMACGRAVLGTDIPGIREVIVPRETGVLVPTDDASALASQLVELLVNDAARERYGRAARARVEDVFSARRMMDDTIQLYGSLLRSA
jgi:glycosyltransferase involved in cell wall biosynthesis